MSDGISEGKVSVEERKIAEISATDIKNLNKTLQKISKIVGFDPSKNDAMKDILKEINKKTVENKKKLEIEKIDKDDDLSPVKKNKLKAALEKKATDEITKFDKGIDSGNNILKLLIDNINDKTKIDDQVINDYIGKSIQKLSKTFMDDNTVDEIIGDKKNQRLRDAIAEIRSVLYDPSDYDLAKLQKLKTALDKLGSIKGEWATTTWFKDKFDFYKASGILVGGISITFVGGLIALATFGSNQQTGSSGSQVTSPSANVNLTPQQIQAIMTAMALNISGCYMLTNDSGRIIVKRLDGCSEWYNDGMNQGFCSCVKTTDKKTLPDCKDQTLCTSPYCLNQGDCTTISGAKKCNQNNEQLYMCNGESANEDGFVMYFYQFIPPSAIPSTIINLLSQKEQQDVNKKLIIIIVISVIVIIVICVIIYIMMNKKSKMKKLKSK
jgi:hypothetical protein